MKIAIDIILISFIVFGYVFLKYRKKKKSENGRQDKNSPGKEQEEYGK